jgi:ubiE/COQ5 methyltransferase family
VLCYVREQAEEFAGTLGGCHFRRSWRLAGSGGSLHAAWLDLVSSNPQSYVYLAESIQVWPDHQGPPRQIGRSGWRSVEWRNLTGGIVALHHATR